MKERCDRIHRMGAEPVEELHSKLAHRLVLVEEAKTERLQAMQVGREP